jgi:hypothetical protein
LLFTFSLTSQLNWYIPPFRNNFGSRTEDFVVHVVSLDKLLNTKTIFTTKL